MGLKSSRRGNLCAVLVCVSTQGYTLTIVAIVAFCFAFSYFDTLDYGFGFLIVIPPSTICFCVSNSFVVAFGISFCDVLFCSAFFLILNHEHV